VTFGDELDDAVDADVAASYFPKGGEIYGTTASGVEWRETEEEVAGGVAIPSGGFRPVLRF